MCRYRYNNIRGDYMEYEKISYFVSKWGITERRIRVLCAERRIEGALKVGKTWLIPKDTPKPRDRRFKNINDIFFDDINTDVIDNKKAIIDDSRPFSPMMVRQLNDKLLVEWTYHSNAIEGNTLTMSETKVVLENGITIKGKPLKDHLEVINHKEAIEYVEELVKKDTKLTEYDIKSIHYLILKQIDNLNAGKYRTENVLISGSKHIPSSYINVPLGMQKLMEQYEDWAAYHPLIRACLLHGEFVKIHPFVDGNGRTARLLLNFELIKNGYPPVIIKNEDRADYYDALEVASTTRDYTLFINFVLNLVNEAADSYLLLLGK